LKDLDQKELVRHPKESRVFCRYQPIHFIKENPLVYNFPNYFTWKPTN